VAPFSLALWVLLTPIAIAAMLAVVACARDRDPRHAVLLALAALVGLASALSPIDAPPAIEAALEPTFAPYWVRLAAHLAALWAVVVAIRSVHERNRAEEVQWSSMEALRAVAGELRATNASALDAAERMIELGCERLGFEGGLLVARIAGGHEILCARAPADLPELAPGPRPELARTLVARCFDGADPVAVDRASDGHWTTHPEHAPFGWQRFLGVRVLAGVESADGAARDAIALAYFDRASSDERLGSVEKSLLQVMAAWLAERAASEQASGALAAREAFEADKALSPVDREVAATAEPTPEPIAKKPERARRDAAPREEDASRGPIDLDRAIDGLSHELARAHGVRVERTRGARGTEIAIDAQALERIASSLVAHAAEIAPRAPRAKPSLELETGVVQGPDDPGPAFATIAVRARGPALDADALAAVYGATASADAPRRLPLSRVVALLRAAGGDLSLESEEGVGTTFTAFLAIAKPAAPPSANGA